MPNVKSVSIVEGKLYVVYCGDTKPPEVFDIPCTCDPVNGPGDIPPIDIPIINQRCAMAYLYYNTIVKHLFAALMSYELDNYIPITWEVRFHQYFYPSGLFTDSSFVGTQHAMRLAAQSGDFQKARLQYVNSYFRAAEITCIIRDLLPQNMEVDGSTKQAIAQGIRSLSYTTDDQRAYLHTVAGFTEGISVPDLRKQAQVLMYNNPYLYQNYVCACSTPECSEPEAWIMTTEQAEAWSTMTGRLGDFPVSSTILNSNTTNYRVESVLTSRGWENASGPCTSEACDAAGIYHRFSTPITLCDMKMFVMLYLAADPSQTPHVGNSSGLALMYSDHVGTGEPPKSSWHLLTDMVIPYPTPVPRTLQYIGDNIPNVTAIGVIALHGGSYQAITLVSINQ